MIWLIHCKFIGRYKQFTGWGGLDRDHLRCCSCYDSGGAEYSITFLKYHAFFRKEAQNPSFSRVWWTRASKQLVVYTTLVLRDLEWVSRLQRLLLLMATFARWRTWDRWVFGPCSGLLKKGTCLPLKRIPLALAMISLNVTVFVTPPVKIDATDPVPDIRKQCKWSNCIETHHSLFVLEGLIDIWLWYISNSYAHSHPLELIPTLFPGCFLFFPKERRANDLGKEVEFPFVLLCWPFWLLKCIQFYLTAVHAFFSGRVVKENGNP